MSSAPSPQREGLTWAKTSRLIALPFCPSRLETFMKVKRFEDISIDQLLAKGVEGILLDADGTLGPHHAREYNLTVIDHVRAMLEKGFKIAIYTNAWEDRFQPFQERTRQTRPAWIPDRHDRLSAVAEPRQGVHDWGQLCNRWGSNRCGHALHPRAANKRRRTLPSFCDPALCLSLRQIV